MTSSFCSLVNARKHDQGLEKISCEILCWKKKRQAKFLQDGMDINAIHRIKHYPVESIVCFVNTCRLHSDLSGGGTS